MLVCIGIIDWDRLTASQFLVLFGRQARGLKGGDEQECEIEEELTRVAADSINRRELYTMDRIRSP
jgi:hypothetical protein